MSTSNPYAPKNVSNKSTEKTVAQEEDTLKVPNGTISEVTAWVGDDKDRAKAALEAEKTNAKRVTLINTLEELLEKD